MLGKNLQTYFPRKNLSSFAEDKRPTKTEHLVVKESLKKITCFYSIISKKVLN
jgi:hypothetical protein